MKNPKFGDVVSVRFGEGNTTGVVLIAGEKSSCVCLTEKGGATRNFNNDQMTLERSQIVGDADAVDEIRHRLQSLDDHNMRLNALEDSKPPRGRRVPETKKADLPTAQEQTDGAPA